VGSRLDDGNERPKAVSEYLLERMVKAGADRICFIISPGKSDILQYFGDCAGGAHICYVVQPRPRGLCDAVFAALPFLGADDDIAVGLPDTIWFPDDALTALPSHMLSFLLFPVERPEFFDAVVIDDAGRVQRIQVKEPRAVTSWVWGAFRMPVRQLRLLHELWIRRNRQDEYIGTLVNAYLQLGGEAIGVRAGEAYVDVGTIHGYRAAINLLSDASSAGVAPDALAALRLASS
jgi:glucose-1-phosphate thymidylyltransferase